VTIHHCCLQSPLPLINIAICHWSPSPSTVTISTIDHTNSSLTVAIDHAQIHAQKTKQWSHTKNKERSHAKNTQQSFTMNDLLAQSTHKQQNHYMVMQQYALVCMQSTHTYARAQQIESKMAIWIQIWTVAGKGKSSYKLPPPRKLYQHQIGSSSSIAPLEPRWLFMKLITIEIQNGKKKKEHQSVRLC